MDLIYLDPPFNSKATYNVLFAEKNGSASTAQIQAFDDFWHWDDAAAAAFYEVVEAGGRVAAASGRHATGRRSACRMVAAGS